MEEQTRNLILATALCFLVIVGWALLSPPRELPLEQAPPPASQQTGVDTPGMAPLPTTPGPMAGAADGAQTDSSAAPASVGDAPRIPIDTPRLVGSLSLAGGRIDELRLRDYRVTIKSDAPIVTLFSPASGVQPFYALFGWAPAGGMDARDVPGPRTLWEVAEGGRLSPQSPLLLRWSSPGGMSYTRKVEIDNDYMFTITQSVTNQGAAPAMLSPYGMLARHSEPIDLKNFFILHEGIIRMADGELAEVDYDDMTDREINQRDRAHVDSARITENGWIGFTDHYWMAALVPEGGTPFSATAKYLPASDIYSTEAVMSRIQLAPGESASTTMRMFAGAKEWESISRYQDAGAARFTDSIDWGWFFFLTKPIFIALHWFKVQIGNMGWAIICLTLLIKALLFPLAYRSYVSMARMKELQPEMQRLKEQAGEDRKKFQQEMMTLYKKEKVNPASGCLPILLQIPIFFSLYKVIFVTLDLRHAPWFGWIKDLSAPDPSSILNLFGLFPWQTPEPTSIFFIVSLGVLPITLGLSMWLQQKLNPAPTDPTQAMIFAWLPWIFMFMLGTFASGLVLYWIANNVITFAQQYIIMRSQGYSPDVFGNIRAGFSSSKSLLSRWKSRQK